MAKKILFLTGTRADYGKLKPLMQAIEKDPSFICGVFVTGMHTLARYGYTVREVENGGFKNIHVFMNQIHGEPMDLILANTISGLSRYVHEYKPDLIVVHGDRVETMAGAIVGALNNIHVAHIEGGEVSGTIDELIRHSVSKLSHIHFVSNAEASNRLMSLGEDPSTIFIIGSPDIDVMLSPNLPALKTVKSYYQIPFDTYSVVAFHPVTTEHKLMRNYTEELVAALEQSGKKYVVIYPNNDHGAEDILAVYDRIKNNPKFKLFPSLRFEYFLTLLKNAEFIIGNSSAGIHEAPVYTVPTINIGTRQSNRFHYKSILNVDNKKEAILDAIRAVDRLEYCEPCLYFGEGNSTSLFLKTLKGGDVWQIPKQKRFYDTITIK